MPETLLAEREAFELGEDDDAHRGSATMDLFSCFQPVDARHAEIEEDKVGLIL